MKAIELGVLKEEDGNVQLEQIAQPLPKGATWPNDILVKTLRCLRCGRGYYGCAVRAAYVRCLRRKCRLRR